jgi:hypothetical protein
MVVVGQYQGQAVEIVEHKGIGHPDSICEAVAEAFPSHCAGPTGSAAGGFFTTTSTRGCWSPATSSCNSVAGSCSSRWG